VVLRHGPDQVVFDCGPLGPPHLPPHAHADALSLVAWFDGEPLLVDRGAFAYAGADRDWFRGTAAHNTVELDRQDQCVFWGDFRASKLPRVRLGQVERREGAVLLSASHDGYRRLPGRPIHRRALIWLPGDGVVILDLIESSRAHEVRSFLHLAPSAELLKGSACGMRLETLGPLPARRIAVRHAPWLGTAIGADALAQAGTISARMPFGWSVLREGASVAKLDGNRIELRRSCGAGLSLELPWGLRGDGGSRRS
jgi:hypothetical protein